MHILWQLIALAFVFIVIVYSATFMHRREWLAPVVGVAGVFLAFFIPQQIDERAREVQKLGNCVNSILDFRRNLLDYYRLKPDDRGMMIDPGQVDGAASDLRIRLQNSKDSTYTLCNGVGDGRQGILNASDSPWKDAPISANEQWSRYNVASLYAWSTDALRFSTTIEPEPIHIPGLPAWLFQWH